MFHIRKLLKVFYIKADIHFYNGTTSVCKRTSLYIEGQNLDIGMFVDNDHQNNQEDNSFFLLILVTKTNKNISYIKYEYSNLK